MSRLLCFVLLFLAAYHAASIAAPANASEPQGDWRRKIGTFRVGIVGGSSAIIATRRIQPFRKALQQELGIPVEIFAARDFGALIEAQAGSRVEYAIYSASAYAAAWLHCKCVQPLAAPTGVDGATGLRSVMLSNGGGPKTLRNLRHAPVIVPGKTSFSGYILPAYELLEKGIDLKSGLYNVVDAGTPLRAFDAYRDTATSVLLSWEPVYPQQTFVGKKSHPIEVLFGEKPKAKKLGSKPNRVIWRSSTIRFGPHTVRKNLAESAKILLWDFLTGLKENNPAAYDAVDLHFGGGFSPASHSHYLPVVRMIEAGSARRNLRETSVKRTKNDPLRSN